MIIADGHHLPEHVVRVMLRAKGLDRIVLVSDMAPVAGLPEGDYDCLGTVSLLAQVTLTCPMLTHPLPRHVCCSDPCPASARRQHGLRSSARCHKSCRSWADAAAMRTVAASLEVGYCGGAATSSVCEPAQVRRVSRNYAV